MGDQVIEWLLDLSTIVAAGKELFMKLVDVLESCEETMTVLEWMLEAVAMYKLEQSLEAEAMYVLGQSLEAVVMNEPG